MLSILVVLVFTIFDSSTTSKSQSVNLELETVFELDDDKDIHLLDDIQKFVNKVRKVFTKNEEAKLINQDKSESSTDLVVNLIENVKSLQDNELTQLFNVVGEELKAFNFEDTFQGRDLRRLLSNKIYNINKSPSKMRASLDQLLTKIDKNHKLTKFINIVYKKDSKRDISRLLKKLALFRRNSKRPKGELSVIAQNMIYDMLEKYNALTKNNKHIVKSLLQDIIASSDEAGNDYGNIENKSNSIEAKDEETSDEEETKEETQIHTTKKKAKRTRSSKKLTHVTLYPSSIEIENSKRKFKVNKAIKTSKTVKSEERISRNNEEETKRIRTDDLNDEDIKMAVEKEIMDISDNEPTTVAENEKTLRHNKKTTRKFSNSDVSSKSISKSDVESSSYEHFGSLQKAPKTKTDDTLTSVDMPEESVTYKSEREDKSTKILNNNIYLNRRAQNLVLTDNNKTVDNSLEKDNAVTNPGIPKNDYKKAVLDENKEITKKLVKNRQVEEILTSIKDDVTLKQELSTVSESFTTASTSIANDTFDVNNYLNKSEVQSIKDGEKKKKIQDLIKEDLNNLFSTTTNSTDGYTDMFKELEDAFDFS